MIDSYLDPGTLSLRTPANLDLFSYVPDQSQPKDRKQYLSMVMSLMYLARLTRPDILLATTFLASRSASPTVDDWNRGARIVRYLAGTKNYGVAINCEGLKIYVYCDASYGSRVDGHSHSGYVLSLGDSLSYLSA